MSKEKILEAYHLKCRKKGARQIKIILKGLFDTNYNLKRIRMIMKEYNFLYPVKKANPYRRMAKTTKEHTIVLIY